MKNWGSAFSFLLVLYLIFEFSSLRTKWRHGGGSILSFNFYLIYPNCQSYKDFLWGSSMKFYMRAGTAGQILTGTDVTDKMAAILSVSAAILSFLTVLFSDFQNGFEFELRWVMYCSKPISVLVWIMTQTYALLKSMFFTTIFKNKSWWHSLRFL